MVNWKITNWNHIKKEMIDDEVANTEETTKLREKALATIGATKGKVAGSPIIITITEPPEANNVNSAAAADQPTAADTNHVTAPVTVPGSGQTNAASSATAAPKPGVAAEEEAFLRPEEEGGEAIRGDDGDGEELQLSPEGVREKEKGKEKVQEEEMMSEREKSFASCLGVADTGEMESWRET